MNAMADASRLVNQYARQSKGERKTHCVECGGEIGLRVGVSASRNGKLIPFHLAEPHEITRYQDFACEECGLPAVLS
jgi:hypothetical protein